MTKKDEKLKDEKAEKDLNEVENPTRVDGRPNQEALTRAIRQQVEQEVRAEYEDKYGPLKD